jgi:hypothetical protein
MVMEGLTTLINQVVESSDIHGVKIVNACVLS